MVIFIRVLDVPTGTDDLYCRSAGELARAPADHGEAPGRVVTTARITRTFPVAIERLDVVTLARAAREARVSLWEMMDYVKTKKITAQYDLEDFSEI